MMLLKFRARDDKVLRSFLNNIKRVSNDITNPASRIWSSVKIKISKLSDPNFIIVCLDMEHLIPTIIWKFGLFCLAFALLFWVWFLIPASVLLFFGFMNTRLFMFSMLRLGLRKKGYLFKIVRVD